MSYFGEWADQHRRFEEQRRRKRAFWKTIGWVVFWSIAALVALVALVINWPLSDQAWWAIAFMAVGYVLLQHQHDRQREASYRHEEITEKLRTMDHTVLATARRLDPMYDTLRDIHAPIRADDDSA
jgi:hypothetical protein